MGGRTGRPRKKPQPAGLDDGIYWRPSSKDPNLGNFSVAYKNSTTKKWTTRVIKRGVAKGDVRKKAVLQEVNELARIERERHQPRAKAPAQDVLFKDAWDHFLKNKRNRKKQRLKSSTRQDYASIYEVYFRGAFVTPTPPSKPVRRKAVSKMTPAELAEYEKRRRRSRPRGYSDLTPEELLELRESDPVLLEDMRKRELAGLAGFTLAELAEEWADEQFQLGASRLKRWEAWLDTRAYQGEGIEPDRSERQKQNLISLKRKANVEVVMKSLLSHCYKQGWTTENLGRQLDIPAPDTTTLRKPPRYEKLMELLDELEKYGQQQRVFAELALYSGLRAGELVALDWESAIHFDEEFILVERSYSHGVMSDTTKGLKSRIVPLHDRISSLLQQWQQVCPSKTMVFPATHLVKRDPDDEEGELVRVAKVGQRMSVDTFRQKVWNKATAAVGLEGLRIHDLRHVYITWLASLNVNALLIQKAAGHQDPKVTAAYLDLDPRLYKSIRDAFNSPHGTEAKPQKQASLAEDGTIDFSWAQEPKPKPVERPKKPEHKPGSGLVIKRQAPKNKPLNLT